MKDNSGTSIDQKPSTSLIHSQTISNKSTTKPQTNDAIRRLDFIPEPSFDSNKNYTKNTNKIINGTKVNKKLLDDELDARKARKSWRTSVRNGMVAKSKRHRNLRSSKKETTFAVNVTDEEEDDPVGSNSSFGKTSPQTGGRDGDDDVAVENIAERIKRRKENAEKKTSELPGMEFNASRRSRAAKKKALLERIDEDPAVDQAMFSTSREENTEIDGNSMRRMKRRKMSRSSQNNTEDLEKNELSTDAVSGLRKSARNLTRISSMADESDARNKGNSKFNYDSPPESCDEAEECVPETERTCVSKLLSDEEVIEEQQRIERLLLQEREDFELARRLQAQYDEMERIAGRTRRSRKAIENERSVNVNSREINAARTVRRTSGVRKTAKRKPIVSRVVSTATKGQRGRPKRIKITVDAREDETRTR